MPPVSQAQRRLMQAAAHHKGGFGGVSQKVGKEFEAGDKGGKLPERKSKAEKRYGNPRKRKSSPKADYESAGSGIDGGS